MHISIKPKVVIVHLKNQKKFIVFFSVALSLICICAFAAKDFVTHILLQFYQLEPNVSICCNNTTVPLDMQLIYSYDGSVNADGIGMFMPRLEMLAKSSVECPSVTAEHFELKATSDVPIKSISIYIFKHDIDNDEESWTELGEYSEEAWALLPSGRYLLECSIYTEINDCYYFGKCFVWVEKTVSAYGITPRVHCIIT